MFRRTLAVITGFMLVFVLAACNALVTGTGIPTEPAESEGVDSTKTGEPSRTPGPSSTPTPTEVPLPKIGEGGPYTPEQIAFIESEEGQDQIRWNESWFKYWVMADQSQLAGASWKLIPDMSNPGKYKIVLEAPEDYPNVVFVPPVESWDKMSPPPEAETGHNTLEEFGPTKLSVISGEDLYPLGIPLGSTLVVDDGNWAFWAGGQVVARVEGKTWKAVFEVIDQGKYDYMYFYSGNKLELGSLPEVSFDEIVDGRLDYSVRYKMSKIEPPEGIMPIDVYSISNYRGAASKNKILDVGGFLQIYYNHEELWPMRPVAIFKVKSPVSGEDSLILVQEVFNKDGTSSYVKLFLENAKRRQAVFNDITMFGGKYHCSFEPFISIVDDVLPIPSPETITMYQKGIDGMFGPYNLQTEEIIVGVQEGGKLPDKIILNRVFAATLITIAK